MSFQLIDPVALAALQAGEQCLLVDVRTDAEVARGIIAGALHVALPTLPGRLHDLPFDKTIVFYCQSGARSSQACAWFAQQGGTRIYNLQGGVVGWMRAGYALQV